MSAVATEHVLVVPTSAFYAIGYFQGFSTQINPYLQGLLRPEHMSYRPRSAMEADPSFKQLIPYVVFRYTSPSGEISLFQYTRGKGQGEQRLHSKRSIGIGGHISSDDASAQGAATGAEGATATAIYEEGMRRELAEEVRINTPYRSHIAGLINDDLTEVGKVHLGVVHLFDVERPAVSALETEIISAGFQPVSQLLHEVEQFETWSKICLQALFGQP